MVASLCGHTPAATAYEFTAVTPALTDLEKRQVRASPSVMLEGQHWKTGYHPLLRTGQKLGDHVYGQLLDESGKPLRRWGHKVVSHSNDYTSLIATDDQLLMVSQFEDRPAAVYLSELEQNSNNGLLSVKRMRPIDFSQINGGWLHCAGSVTPWHSHLGSEEYPPDARYANEPGHAINAYFAPMADYYDDASHRLNPYHYGYPVEIKFTDFDNSQVVKHYSMGRISHEKALVLPDLKTVYLADDQSNAVFLRYQARRPGDLSEGKLFAARWEQTTENDPTLARLSWISLGNARDADIAEAIAANVEFEDIFKVGKLSNSGACADADFGLINTGGSPECLQVKSGMETIASRLETRRFAALLGATTEFRKLEGMSYSASRNALFLSVSSVNKGMEDNHPKYDAGGNNHIRLPRNRCGGVFNFQLNDDYIATAVRAEVVGKPLKKKYGAAHNKDRYPKDGPLSANACHVDHIANPDNLALDERHGLLFIGEDTGAGHQNDALWAYDLNDQQLTRLLTSPYGAETTSVAWFPDINGWSYLMTNIQHPYGESDKGKARDSNDLSAYTGYLGPFPAVKRPD